MESMNCIWDSVIQDYVDDDDDDDMDEDEDGEEGEEKQERESLFSRRLGPKYEYYNKKNKISGMLSDLAKKQLERQFRLAFLAFLFLLLVRDLCPDRAHCSEYSQNGRRGWIAEEHGIPRADPPGERARPDERHIDLGRGCAASAARHGVL